MSHKIRLKVKFIVSLILAGILLCKMPVGIVQAVSCDIYFIVDRTDIVEGEVFGVELVLSAPEALGDFQGVIEYDSEVLDLISYPACATLRDTGILMINDNSAVSQTGERSYILKFIARKIGTTTLKMPEKPYVASLSSGVEMTAMVTPKNITVSSMVTATPTSVPPTNTPMPTEAPLPTPTRAPLVSEVLKEKVVAGCTVSNESYGTIVTEYHTYICAYSMEGLTIPEGYEKTTLYLDGNALVAYAKGKGSQEFLLLPLLNEKNETNWYWYDRVEQTLQRVHQEDITNAVYEVNYDDKLLATIKDYEKKQNILLILAAFWMVTSIGLVIGIATNTLKNKKKVEKPKNAKRRR